MNHKEPVYVIPEGIDLGDVTNAPAGTLVTTLDVSKTGKPIINPSLYVVDRDDGTILRLRVASTGKPAGSIVKARNGASPNFMYRGYFYYSANPSHVALAEKTIKAAKVAREKREALRKEKMALAAPIGEMLGDGEAVDSDGDHYHSTHIAEELADRLTNEQLVILAGWLKGEKE